MDNLDPLTDVMGQMATEQAALSKLCIIKERLENEVVAKKKELARLQGVKRKQQEKHTQPQKKQKTRQNTNTHCEVCQTIFTMAQTWHHKYINQTQCLCG